MLIHFKCPNGHALKVSSDYAGKRSKCPQCEVPVVVPTPHRTPHSGASAERSAPRRRPAASRKAAVAASHETKADLASSETPSAPPLDDDDICDLLGPPPPVDTSPAAQETIERQFAPHDPARLLKRPETLAEDMRRCPECDAAIKRTFHVCPHCRTYLNDDVEALSKSATSTCLNCGGSYALSADRCPHCGQTRVHGD